MFGCLIFFGVIALIYLVIGVVWFVLSAVYMKELMAVRVRKVNTCSLFNFIRRADVDYTRHFYGHA